MANIKPYLTLDKDEITSMEAFRRAITCNAAIQDFYGDDLSKIYKVRFIDEIDADKR